MYVEYDMKDNGVEYSGVQCGRWLEASTEHDIKLKE